MNLCFRREFDEELCQIHLNQGSVGDIDFAVAVGVCQSESLNGERLQLGDMSLNRGHVTDIHSAVKVCVARQTLRRTGRTNRKLDIKRHSTGYLGDSAAVYGDVCVLVQPITEVGHEHIGGVVGGSCLNGSLKNIFFCLPHWVYSPKMNPS